MNEAYRNANLWWRPDRGGARIELVGREVVDNVRANRLRVIPHGGKASEAWFDAAQHGGMIGFEVFRRFVVQLDVLRSGGPRSVALPLRSQLDVPRQAV